MSTTTDSVLIYAQLEPSFGQPGHIETIQFTDGAFTIGSASAPASASSSSAAKVDELNEASEVSASKKDEMAKEAKKIRSKAQTSPKGPEEIKPTKDNKEEE